jgi:hypothetical protein
MEDQTAFELNQAIQRWRENLANSPAFRRENLNELESHLRDSLAALKARGLPAEDAFLVATRRIGKSQQLEPEFSKLNRGTVWLGRAMWMLIGLQVWPFFESLMSGIAGNLFALGLRGVTPLGLRRVSPQGLLGLTYDASSMEFPIFVSTLVQLPALIIAVWLTWTVVRKSGRFGEWVATKLPRRSSFVLCCIAACVLAFVGSALLIALLVGQWQFSGSAVTVGIMSRSRTFIAPLRVIGFAVLTLVVARKLLGRQKILADQASFDLNQSIQTWRESLARVPAFRCENLNDLESHLRDSVAALRTRGLSTEESFLIATRHIGQGQPLEPEFDKINRDTLWLGRALWMLIGIQFWPFIENLMSGLAGNFFALAWRNVHHSPSAVGEAWPIFFATLIQLPALALAVWLSWRVLRNSEKLGQWIAAKLPERSSFILCCIVASVLACLLYALERFLPMGWHKISGDFMHVPGYIAASRTFVAIPRVIGFIILTLFLARKQFVPEKV